MSTPAKPDVRPTLQRGLQDAGEVVAALFAGLGYLWRRRVRAPYPRVGFAGRGEVFALLMLAIGIIAACMLLVDPLVHGLRLRLPNWLVILSERLTDLGLGGVILWPIGLAILYVLALRLRLFGSERLVASSMFARLGFLFLAIAPVGLGVAIVKHIIGRARPYVAMHLPGPNAQLTFDLPVWNASFASFPSGHSTTVFATAVALGALFPKARWPLIVLAIVAASTRVILNAHYPSDVIAGAVVSTVYVVWMVKVFAARRVVFSVSDEGYAVPMAGPSARRLACLVPGVARNTPVPLEETIK